MTKSDKKVFGRQMNHQVNVGFFMGRVVRVTDLKESKLGNVYCFLDMCNNMRLTEETGKATDFRDFASFSCYGRMAETVSGHLKKGDHILVVYKLTSTSRRGFPVVKPSALRIYPLGWHLMRETDDEVDDAAVLDLLGLSNLAGIEGGEGGD